MATPEGAILRRHIRKLTSASDANRQLDGQLIHRYLGGDEAAFAALVERHGPLVRNVCRSVLRFEQDAEDVFQATFLVLARTAPSIRKPQAVSSWLHGVAYRLALRLRRRNERQRRHEQQVPSPTPAVTMEDVTWRELRAILHEELLRLAEKYRLPLLLCYWEGKTRDEAAAQLGWTCGTLKERLQRGRNLLRSRLTRRGLVPSAALIAAFLAERAADAALSAVLVQQTTQASLCFAAGNSASTGLPTAAVASLAHDAFRTTRLTRWAMVLLILVGLGGSGIAIDLSLRVDTLNKVEAAQSEADPKDSEPEYTVLASGLPQEAGQPLAQPRTEFRTDPLPAGATAQFGSPRFQGDSIDRKATFSPDGKRLATVGNHFLSIWEVATGKRVETLPTRGNVDNLRWKADGKIAALVSFGREWFQMEEFTPGQKPDPEDQARLDEKIRGLGQQLDGKRGARGRLYSDSLSADGRWVVAVRNNDSGGWTEIYRFTPGETSETIEPGLRVDAASGRGAWLSEDGKVLLNNDALGQDKSGRILAFDVTAEGKGKPAWTLPLVGSRDRIPTACFSLHGKEVVIHFSDGAVELWDGPLGKRIRDFPKVPMFYHQRGLAYNGEWGGVDLSVDGKRLALMHRGVDGTVGGRIVDIQTGKDLCTLVPLPMPRLNFDICFSADGSRVARVASGVVRIWNAETGADACPLPGHRGGVGSIAVVGNGKTIVTTGADFTVRAWGSRSGDERWRKVLPMFPSIKFAIADYIVVSQDESWDSQTPGLLIEQATGRSKPLPGELGKAKRALPLAVSPDGKKVVTLADDAKKPAFEVWSWPTGERLAHVPLEPLGKFGLSYCDAAYFTPDGKQFVAVLYYDDPAEQETMRRVPAHPFIERWDLTAGKLLERTKPGKGNRPQLLPCDKGLWLWTAENEVRDAITGALIVKLQFPEDKMIEVFKSRAVAISSDGKSLAIAEDDPFRSSGNRIAVFDLNTGKLDRTLHANSSINALHYLPDGGLVSLGQTAIVWSVSAGKP